MSMTSKITHNSGLNTKKLIADMPEGEKRILVKTLLGSATGISKRKAPDGEKTYEGLMGSFEGLFPNTDAPESSGILYLPEGMVEKFLAPFRAEKPPSAMDIAIEVYMIRATNPQGYSWELNPLLAEVNESDPVEIIKRKLAEKKIVIKGAGDTAPKGKGK